MQRQLEKKYKGRNTKAVSEYYKATRTKCCYVARGLYSILLPIMIAMWIVPIYEVMHEETDRLNILLFDWNSNYPLTDIKLMPPIATTS